MKFPAIQETRIFTSSGKSNISISYRMKKANANPFPSIFLASGVLFFFIFQGDG